MADHPPALEHMMAAWNERDPDKIRGHLEKALAPEVRFVDPSIDLKGIDAFEANVHEVQSRIPGASYGHVSRIDSHHNFHRYHWAIHQDGKLLLPGYDVTETNEDGLVVCVIGFFGELEKD